MGALRCVDGSSLMVRPVPATDSTGRPYEARLELSRDGRPFGTVGHGCGYFLERAAARLGEAAEGELFAFEPSGRGPGASEMRCVVRSAPRWDGGSSRWAIERKAIIEAWGENGSGVRVILTERELSAFLDDVLTAIVRAIEGYGR
ncbi:hypothetical protein [Actinocorallia longicatena]|uniref:Uncharacterized protein n=1 Tax=Actinocorallia longicatena TaxID=111803 RepID=A0ABP6Q1D1_9ACTN